MDETETPFTPTEIRQKVGLENGVWVKEPYLGIVLGISEHAWRADQVSAVAVSFARPANGPGYVGIGVYAGAKQETLISTKLFEGKILEWARHISTALNSVGVPTKENDEGYNA